MIVRPPLHWLQMLFAWRGSVLGKVLPQLCLTTLLALGVAVAKRYWPAAVPDLTPVPFTLLGIALAIFLGFRNSVSYERYWEARKLWGAVLNDTRTLARQVTSLSNADLATQTAFVHTLIAYVHALRAQLRNTDAASDLARLLSPDDLAAVLPARYRPAMILMQLGQQLRQLRLQRQIPPVLCAAMDRHLGQLNDSLGGCERIAGTPIPFAYTVIVHRTTYLYSFLLPFGLVSSLGLLAPVIVAFVSYTFFALEALAEEIQEPFGLEPHDLALDAMSAMIEATLRESLGERELPPPQQPVDYRLT